MKSYRLAIVGITGRMGQSLEDLAHEFHFEVTAGVGRRQSDGWAPEISLVGKPGALNEKNVDVVIDFSLPELTAETTQWCKKHSKPLVSGVTGLSGVQRQGLEDLAKSVPVLWSANMSPAVTVMQKMLAELAKIPDHTLQVEEIHHSEKLDKPSGTALALQAALEKALPEKAAKPLPPISIRGGGVRGVHRVLSLGKDEMLLVEHVVFDRQAFARGALRAARWLMSAKPGFYGISDIL